MSVIKTACFIELRRLYAFFDARATPWTSHMWTCLGRVPVLLHFWFVLEAVPHTLIFLELMLSFKYNCMTVWSTHEAHIHWHFEINVERDNYSDCSTIFFVFAITSWTLFKCCKTWDKYRYFEGLQWMKRPWSSFKNIGNDAIGEAIYHFLFEI